MVSKKAAETYVRRGGLKKSILPHYWIDYMQYISLVVGFI